MNPFRWPDSIFETLRSGGIPHCLIRAAVEPGGDLDVLVDPTRFNDAVRCLRDAGFRVLRTSRVLPFKSVLVRCLEDGVAVLDLHTALVQNGLVYMDAPTVLASVRWDGGIPRPAPSFLGAILLCHCLLGKGEIPDKHADAIRAMVAGTPEAGWESALAAPELAPVLKDALANLDRIRSSPETIQDLRAQLYTSLDTWSARSRRFRATAYRVLRTLLGPSAPLWAFVGPDGSGKSTLCHALQDLVRRSGIARARVVYLGPWGHYQLPIVSGDPFVPGWSLSARDWWRLIRHPENEKGDPAGLWARMAVLARAFLRLPLSPRQRSIRERMKTASRIFVTLRFARTQASAALFYATLMIENGYRYAKAWLARRRGIFVLADRYVYDLSTGGMHRTVAAHAGFRRILCRLHPPPTRGFVLLNAPAAIRSRKADLSPEELDRFLDIYRDLAQKYDFEIIVTDRSPEALAWSLFRRYFDEIVESLRW